MAPFFLCHFILAGIRQRAGDAVFDEILARGRAMTVEQAGAYALAGIAAWSTRIEQFCYKLLTYVTNYGILDYESAKVHINRCTSLQHPCVIGRSVGQALLFPSSSTYPDTGICISLWR